MQHGIFLYFAEQQSEYSPAFIRSFIFMAIYTHHSMEKTARTYRIFRLVRQHHRAGFGVAHAGSRTA